MKSASADPNPTTMEADCRQIAVQAKRASVAMAQVPSERKNEWLRCAAADLRTSKNDLLAANAIDIADANRSALPPPVIDRLTLSPARIDDLAIGLEDIAALADPNGEVIETIRRPNGLQIAKVRVPLGVVFFVYESRPNVTADAAAICVKSGNAVILRGGKEAANSSRAIVNCLLRQAEKCGLPDYAVQLVAGSDREAVSHFLALPEYIDLAIPRGGEALIRLVARQARMPVIKHFTGNCHVYVDRDADLAMALAITVNSKCHRLGVCNACESLLVHVDIAPRFLPEVGRELLRQGIELRGDEITCVILPQAKRADEADYYAEYLGPVISIKVVSSVDAAIDHINHYGSHHTDAIVTGDAEATRKFVTSVDSAAVMVNASTRFNDGAQFGLGAEIGISTDKFHARGPCGLKELTTYKYVCYGNGQIRS